MFRYWPRRNGKTAGLTFTNADTDFDVAVIRSSDRGKTWSSKAVRVSTSLDAYVFTPHGYFVRSGDVIPILAVDPANGNLYAGWQDADSDGGATKVRLSVSRDGGRTWSASITASRSPSDVNAFVPAIAVTRTGIVALSYYATVGAWRIEVDPDSYGVPIVTSSVDFVGTVILIYTVIAIGRRPGREDSSWATTRAESADDDVRGFRGDRGNGPNFVTEPESGRPALGRQPDGRLPSDGHNHALTRFNPPERALERAGPRPGPAARGAAKPDRPAKAQASSRSRRTNPIENPFAAPSPSAAKIATFPPSWVPIFAGTKKKAVSISTDSDSIAKAVPHETGARRNRRMSHASTTPTLHAPRKQATAAESSRGRDRNAPKIARSSASALPASAKRSRAAKRRMNPSMRRNPSERTEG
jgi:hypothetical protein